MKLITTKPNKIKSYIISIPTYARYNIIYNKTLNTLYKCNIIPTKIYLFLANNEEYLKYIASYNSIKDKEYNKWLNKIKCVIGVLGLKNQRNYISKFFKEGQEIIQMDDDIQDLYYLNVNVLEPKNRKKWRLISFKNKNVLSRSGKTKKNIKQNKLSKQNESSNQNNISTKLKNKLNTKKSNFINNNIQTLDKLFTDVFKKCKNEGIYLWGIYPVENAYFMSPNRTTDLRFIVGPCFGIINRHKKELELTIDEKENVERTLQYWSIDGKVLRLNDITLRTQYYKTPGGMQYEGKQRKEEAMKSAEYLNKKYPNLTKIYLKKKSGHPEIKLISPKK